jgi:nitroimidazol reductase NimA-like FMN-containing flavoprotein (pyridoxamine 5'-phosphate oxidase superfamily)
MEAEECRHLLAAGRFGRLAVVTDGQPQIFPVNYRFEGHSVVFHTGDGTKLAGADLRRVSFEIDEVDADGGGWSVVAQGTGFEIADARDHDSEHLRDLEVDAVGASTEARPVRLVVDQITGRRIPPRPAAPG